MSCIFGEWNLYSFVYTISSRMPSNVSNSIENQNQNQSRKKNSKKNVFVFDDILNYVIFYTKKKYSILLFVILFHNWTEQQKKKIYTKMKLKRKTVISIDMHLSKRKKKLKKMEIRKWFTLLCVFFFWHWICQSNNSISLGVSSKKKERKKNSVKHNKE